MLEKYLIGDNSLKNVAEQGRITGFQIDVRMGYYRHLGLSMVEAFDVNVDGVSYPRERNLFSVRGKTYTYEQMEVEYNDYWEFGETATLTIPKDGGLKPGSHQIELVETLRVSYMPMMTYAKAMKELTLVA